MVTDPQTNTQTDRGDYNTLHRSFASAQCNNNKFRRFFQICCNYRNLLWNGVAKKQTSDFHVQAVLHCQFPMKTHNLLMSAQESADPQHLTQSWLQCDFPSWTSTPPTSKVIHHTQHLTTCHTTCQYLSRQLHLQLYHCRMIQPRTICE